MTAIPPDRRAAMLEVFANLSHFHREHEKYYGQAPLRDARELLSASRTLKALAEHWRTAAPAADHPASPYAGAADLNDTRAIEAAGVLFMESGEPPAEIGRITRQLEAMAAEGEAGGAWLATAMESAWEIAEGLLDFPELADLVAERHAIIVHDWQSAGMQRLIGRLLRRANAVLERVDFSVAALRADLAGERRAPARLFAAAELIDQAADLVVESSTLVRANERRWRVFNDRLASLGAAEERTAVAGDGGPG